MIFKPHQYQIFSINQIIDIPKVALFLDCGLGKSIITLTAITELKYDMFQVSKVLIIAPKKVAESTWTMEAAKWDHTRILKISTVLGGAKKREMALHTPADIYVINRENVAWLCDYFKDRWPFDMVVVDESSSFKSHNAKRFRSLAAMYGRIKRMVLLTGTPTPNSMDDLWSQIYLLDQGERLGKRYGGFRTRYFDPAARGRDGTVYTYRIKDGSEAAILRAVSDICVSMKADDYLELPDIIEDEIPVQLDETATRAYRELEREMIMQLPNDEEISVTSAAALSNKLLQLANGAVYDDSHAWHKVHDCKLEAFEELMESLIERGRQALVFYNFQHDRERIRLRCSEHRDWNVRSLDRDEDIRAWNEGGKVDILLAHPASAAYGLNLQAGGHHVVWFGLTWNYEQYTQANARLHRQGQAEKVIVHSLVCTGTRDEDVIAALARKDQAQQYVMNSLKARVDAVRRGRNR